MVNLRVAQWGRWLATLQYLVHSRVHAPWSLSTNHKLKMRIKKEKKKKKVFTYFLHSPWIGSTKDIAIQTKLQYEDLNKHKVECTDCFERTAGKTAYNSWWYSFVWIAIMSILWYIWCTLRVNAYFNEFVRVKKSLIVLMHIQLYSIRMSLFIIHISLLGK